MGVKKIYIFVELVQGQGGDNKIIFVYMYRRFASARNAGVFVGIFLFFGRGRFRGPFLLTPVFFYVHKSLLVFFCWLPFSLSKDFRQEKKFKIFFFR